MGVESFVAHFTVVGFSIGVRVSVIRQSVLFYERLATDITSEESLLGMYSCMKHQTVCC